MQRSELEHIIRASGEVAQDDKIVIIGSQSILGQFPNAPTRLLVSEEFQSNSDSVFRTHTVIIGLTRA